VHAPDRDLTLVSQLAKVPLQQKSIFFLHPLSLPPTHLENMTRSWTPEETFIVKPPRPRLLGVYRTSICAR
jgi:hypothetical protein